MKRLLFIIGVGLLVLPLSRAADSRALRFQADSPEQVRAWQPAARQRLFELMMGGAPPARVPLEPKLLRRVEKPAAGYALEELTLQTLAELGYVVVAPDIGQHELQHPG